LVFLLPPLRLRAPFKGLCNEPEKRDFPNEINLNFDINCVCYLFLVNQKQRALRGLTVRP